MLVALGRRGAAVRVDRDEPRAAPLRFLRARPEVHVGRDRIAAPDQDQPAVLELLEVHAEGSADGRGPAGLAGGRTDRAVEQRRAQPMEEAAVHRAVLQQAHRAGVAVRQDGLRAVGRRGDVREPVGDGRERLVPRDAREAAFALATDAAHRMQHALVRVRAVEVAGHLRAQHAGRGRMVGRTADGDRAAVLDGGQQRAGVGAVVRARAAHDMPSGRRRRLNGHDATRGCAAPASESVDHHADSTGVAGGRRLDRMLWP